MGRLEELQPAELDVGAILLSADCQRPDGNLLPLPGSLRGGAATKVVAALLARGLAEERVLDATTKSEAGLSTVWRNLDDGRGVLLVIKRLVATRSASHPRAHLAPPWRRMWRRRRGSGAEPARRSLRAPQRPRTREGTKQALLVGLLDRPKGATIDEIIAATGWQQHTVRGAFAGR